MTPTSAERREVAERLRETKAECDKRDYPWMVDDLMQALGFETYEDGEDGIFDYLADLIDPTCTAELKRVVVDEHYRHTRLIPTCSVCGSPLDGGIWIPRFCPSCGARRVPRKVTH